jgi:hypothetical protein
MFSRLISSVVITETVAGTSSSGRRVRVAAVVTAWRGVGTGCVVEGAGVVGRGDAAGGATGGVCADSGTVIVPPSAVLASNSSGRIGFSLPVGPKEKRTLAGSGS